MTTQPQPPKPASPVQFAAPSPKKMNGAEVKRRQVRDQLWKRPESVTWFRKKEKGFTTIPRTLSLIMTLIKELADRGDPSRAYADLWSRVGDDGMIVVNDEAECAISSGYVGEGGRNVRTWNEHLNTLESLGFIACRPKSGRKHGYILLIHPHKVVAWIERQTPGRIPRWWMQAYRERILEIGSTESGYNEIEAFLSAAATDDTTP